MKLCGHTLTRADQAVIAVAGGIALALLPIGWAISITILVLWFGCRREPS